MLRTVALRLAAAALSTPLLLVGCAGTVPPAGDPPATPDLMPEARRTSPDAPPPFPMRFADGAELDPGMTAQWGDAFSTDPEYVLTEPDDGNGAWAYTHPATRCIVHFWQGGFTGHGRGDDRALTDELLAFAVEVAPDEVTRHAADGTLSQLAGGTVDVRTVAGRGSTGNFFMAARAFGALRAGLVVDVGCPAGQDPRDLYGAIRTGHLAILVDPASDE